MWDGTLQAGKKLFIELLPASRFFSRHWQEPGMHLLLDWRYVDKLSAAGESKQMHPAELFVP